MKPTAIASVSPLLAVSAVCLFATSAVQAAALDPLGAALSGGKPNLDLRLRYEDVAQDNALEDASAYTLRARLGYTPAKWNGLDAQLEYESVTALGDDDYNSTENGRTTHSVIPDPATNDLNQAWLRYSGLPDTVLKLGRQRLIFDNARYIGNVGRRQLEQTCNAYLLTSTWIPKTTFNYAYVTNVDSFRFATVDGRLTTNRDMDGSHLINVKVALRQRNRSAAGQAGRQVADPHRQVRRLPGRELRRRYAQVLADGRLQVLSTVS